MRGQHHGGKGSSPRPTNKRRFDENYETIFNKKAPENQVELDEGIHTPEGDGRSGESKFREYAEGQGVQGQADQEQAVEPYPIAWMYDKPLSDGFSERTLSFGDESEFDGVITPLYAHPPKREPLSDDVIDRLRRTDLINVDCGYAAGLRLARLIEKAHGIGE